MATLSHRGAPSADPREATAALVMMVVLAVYVAWRIAGALPSPPDLGTAAPAPIPDGNAFVFVEAATIDGLVVDVATVYSGDAARTAALADGAIETHEMPANGVYIRNPDHTSVTIDVADDATFTVLSQEHDGSLSERQLTFEELAESLSGDGPDIFGMQPDRLPATVFVKNGIVTGLVQHYLP